MPEKMQYLSESVRSGFSFEFSINFINELTLKRLLISILKKQVKNLLSI